MIGQEIGSAQTPTGAGSSGNCSGSATTRTVPLQTGAPPASSSWIGRYRLATVTPAPPTSTRLAAPRSARGNLPTAQKPAPPDRAPRTPWPIAHWLMVWASRSSASATAAAVQSCASSHSACHLSRSRGVVVARYIRRRTSACSMPHRSSSAPISSMPTATPTRTSRSFPAHLNRPYPTPNPCVFHLGFGLDEFTIWSAIHRKSTERVNVPAC